MLSKLYRLTRRGSFVYVQSHGTKYYGSNMVLISMKGKCKRVGFVVSNKLGKAVKRNLIKRRMRGVIGDCLDNILFGQLVFVARQGIQTLSYSEIQSQMHELLKKAKLFKE